MIVEHDRDPSFGEDLLDHAIKDTPGEGLIRLGVGSLDGEAAAKATDIPPESLLQRFDRFDRLPPAA